MDGTAGIHRGGYGLHGVPDGSIPATVDVLGQGHARSPEGAPRCGAGPVVSIAARVGAAGLVHIPGQLNAAVSAGVGGV